VLLLLLLLLLQAVAAGVGEHVKAVWTYSEHCAMPGTDELLSLRVLTLPVRKNYVGTHSSLQTHNRQRYNQTTNHVKQSVFEKLTVTQLIKKFPASYETRMFITVFTTASHRTLYECGHYWTRLEHGNL
jgi:hypothetical protein